MLIYNEENIFSANPTWFFSASPLLPRQSALMASAYDENKGIIWLLGGQNDEGQQLISYNVQESTFTDYGETNLTSYVKGDGQYYTQIGNTLWIIHYSGQFFSRFDLDTIFFEDYSSVPIPISVGDNACLASFILDNHDFLVVVGGYDAQNSNIDAIDDVQILNLTSSVWISNVTKMQEKRRNFACIIYDMVLYAIGGYDYFNGPNKNTIEYLNIGDLNNIQSEQWNYTPNNLSQPIKQNKAVIYETDIIVISGQNAEAIKSKVSDIHIIDTMTKEVRVEGSLDCASDDGTAIVAYPLIYYFGGRNNDGQVFDTWQYFTLPLRLSVFIGK